MNKKSWNDEKRSLNPLTVNLACMAGDGDDETTKLQDSILNTYDMTIQDPESIAEECDCSMTYVRETLNEYRSGWNDDSGFGDI